MAQHPNSLANLEKRGRTKGSKNKISIKKLTDLQTDEEIEAQWGRLMEIVKTGKHTDAINAIKLIWTHTMDNEDAPEIEEDIFDIKEAQKIILEAVQNGFKNVTEPDLEDD